MAVELAKAVVSRWNAAGLDSSLGPLRFASGTFSESTSEILASSERSNDVFGADPESLLPRYEYAIDFDDSEMLGQAVQVLVNNVRFHCYRKSELDAMNDVETIRDQFVNAEAASSNAMTIPSSVGNLMGVQHVTRATVRLAKNVVLGIEQIEIRWAEAVSAPS